MSYIDMEKPATNTWKIMNHTKSHQISYIAIITTCMNGRCHKSCLWMVFNAKKRKASLHSMKNLYKIMTKSVTKDIYSKLMLVSEGATKTTQWYVSLHSMKNSCETIAKSMTKGMYSKLILRIPRSYKNHTVVYHFYMDE